MQREDDINKKPNSHEKVKLSSFCCPYIKSKLFPLKHKTIPGPDVLTYFSKRKITVPYLCSFGKIISFGHTVIRSCLRNPISHRIDTCSKDLK